MKKFEGYRVIRDCRKKGKYIYCRCNYPKKLSHIYIKNKTLTIDIYCVKSGILTFKTTIKIGNEFQWWQDGVLQTKPLRMSKICYKTIVYTYHCYSNVSFYDNLNKAHKFFSKHYNIKDKIDYVQLLTITTPRKKSFCYLPEKYRTNEILNTDIEYVTSDCIFITDAYTIVMIQNDQIKYYRKVDFVQIPPCYVYTIWSNKYSGLFKYGRTTNKNLGWKLYLINNDLNQILEEISLGRIDLEPIMKLSLSKKRFIDSILYNTLSKVVYQVLKIKNLNSYRDEDLKRLIQTMNHFHFLDMNWVIDNYKKLYSYIEVGSLYYSDYLLLRSRCECVTTKKYPTFPSPDKLLVYHDELVKVYNANVDIINKHKFIKQNEEYQKLKEDLKVLEYNNDKYSIIIPDCLQDVVNEGKNLHHCVSTYINAICEKKNKIYFLRRNSKLDKSWFTIDVDYNNNIRQIHTYCNGNLDSVPEYEDLQNFLLEWCSCKNLNFINFNSIKTYIH